MDQQQIIQLYSVIAANYQSQMANIDSKVYFENMKLFLKEYDYIEVSSNLKKHILESTYLPQIADLVKKEEKTESVFNRVPNPQQTMIMLKQQAEEERKLIGHELDHEAIAEAKRKAFEKIAKAQADMEARKYREE